MAIKGWYYLHTNGSLIYKRELGDQAADIRESDFATTMWAVDLTDREGAWSILVEALSLGANKERIEELADKWACNDVDAYHYAERIGVVLDMDGDACFAKLPNFINLDESPSGFGDTYLEAMAELCKALGYKGGKMWNTTFKDLCKQGCE